MRRDKYRWFLKRRLGEDAWKPADLSRSPRSALLAFLGGRVPLLKQTTFQRVPFSNLSTGGPSCRHPGPEKLHLFLEYCSGGSLAAHLGPKDRKTEAEVHTFPPEWFGSVWGNCSPGSGQQMGNHSMMSKPGQTNCW